MRFWYLGLKRGVKRIITSPNHIPFNFDEGSHLKRIIAPVLLARPCTRSSASWHSSLLSGLRTVRARISSRSRRFSESVLKDAVNPTATFLSITDHPSIEPSHCIALLHIKPYTYSLPSIGLIHSQADANLHIAHGRRHGAHRPLFLVARRGGCCPPCGGQPHTQAGAIQG